MGKNSTAFKTFVQPAGNTAMHVAAAHGQIAALERLWDLEADLESKSARILSTPLHRAVGANQVEAVKWLLAKHADVSLTNKIGNTPLHCAAYNGNVEITELLLRAGAGRFVFTKNKVGMTPFLYARTTALQELLSSSYGEEEKKESR